MNARIIAGPVLVLCFLLSASITAIAAPVEIGIGGGAMVPMSDAGDALKTGWHAKGFVRFPGLGLPLDLGAAIGYSQNKLDTNNLPYDGTSAILSGLGKMSYTLPFSGPIRPYLTLGLGAFRVDTDVNDDGVQDPEPQTQFGFDAGAGIRFGLFGAKAFLEGSLQNIYTEQGFNEAVVENVDTQVVPVTFGVYF